MPITIKALGRRVWVTRDTQTKDTHYSLEDGVKTTLIIPDVVRTNNAPSWGTVLACGPLCEWGLKAGDRVIFAPMAGEELGGTNKILLHEEDLRGIILGEDGAALPDGEVEEPGRYAANG